MARKTVLITGCSDGGLGAALAVAFHNAHWRVLATARNPAKMASLTSLGIETLALDVTSTTSLESATATTSQLTNGTLDMLVNNAGGGYTMPLSDISISEAKALFDLNVWSVIATTQTFLPLLLANPHGATITNHTSVASVAFGPFQGPYAASKAALAALSESSRLELAPFGIRVVDLKTGRVRSNFFANLPANDHGPTLPATSLYSVARPEVEAVLAGEPFVAGAMDAAVWARKVVRDLTGSRPPNVVWKGAQATFVWVTTFLPAWMVEREWKKMTAMDVVEQRLEAQKQQKKAKAKK